MLKNKHHNRPGAILLFSLVSMGIITMLTQQLIKSVSVGIVFSASMVRREQVEMLVYGGLAIAMAQLEECFEEPKKKQEGQSEPSAQPESGAAAGKKTFSFKKFITSVLPHLNRFQAFELQEAYDGLDGLIKICIVSEEGKLPMSLVFDEPSRDLAAQSKNLLKQFAPFKKSPPGDFGAKLTTALKTRTHKMPDISLLASCASECKVDLWYNPPLAPASKKEKPQPAAFAMQDAFTLWAAHTQLNPLCLSNAACMIMGLRQPLAGDETARKDQYKQLAENYEKIKALKDEQLWKSLNALYDAKPTTSADFSALFSLEVEPRFYSVLSCATVAGVTQQLLAVIERVEPSVSEVKRRGQEQKKKDEQPLFAVRRIYWL